jgi:hypothetical protein
LKRGSTLFLLLLTLASAACEEDADPSDDDQSADDVMDDDQTRDAAADEKSDGGARNDAAASDGGKSSMDGGKDAAPSGSADAAPGDPNVRVGEFSLRLVPPLGDSEPYTTLLGKVSDGPVPEGLIWEQQEEAGGCKLLTPRVPFCADKPCGGSATCVEDGVCQSEPKSQNVGTVTVRGVRTTTGESEFAAENINNTYQANGSLPYPAFDEGGAIEVAAAGGDVGAFTLKGKGIAPLALAGSDTGYPLERGKGINLSWNAPKPGGNTRIQIKLDISHHGGTNGKVECDVPDNGALAIPVGLTDKLLALGIAGFPTIMVTRSSLSSVTTRLGRVDLRIYEYVEPEIKIPGLVSCMSNEECPSGDCLDDKTCKK